MRSDPQESRTARWVLVARFSGNFARNFIAKRAVLACAVLALAPSCRHTAGSVEDGRYIAHDNAFSLPVPKLSVGMAIQQGLDKDPFGQVTAGYVTFHDDFGNMRSIEYEQITATQLNALTDETRARNYFSSRLHDEYVAKIKVYFPGTHVISEKLVTLEDGSSGWFGVIKIPVPERSKTKTAAEPRAPPQEVARGFLFLPHRNLFLTLSLANDPNNARESAEGESASAEIDHILGELTELYESMRFG